MALKQSDLHDGESVVLDLHPHAIVLARSILALVVSIVVGLVVRFAWDSEGALHTIVNWIVIAAIVLSLVYFFVQWVAMMNSHFVVTTDRCIFNDGVLQKTNEVVPIARINSVSYKQSLFERVVRCGSLRLVSGADTGTLTFQHVRDPARVQHAIQEQINRKATGGSAGSPVPLV